MKISLGQIKALLIPPSWEEAQLLQSEIRHIRRFHPDVNKDISLDICQRIMPLSDKATNSFASLLRNKPALNGPEKLSDMEIKEQEFLMGITSIGDNQYTNKSKLGEKDYPAFDLQLAQTQNLNGKTILLVEGSFQDKDANPLNKYCCLFINGKNSKIEEIFLAVTDIKEFPKYREQLAAILQTIEWQPTNSD